MTSPDSLDGLIARLTQQANDQIAAYGPNKDTGLELEAAGAIERLREERDAALVDARRYWWLRPCLEVKLTKSVAGSVRAALGVHIGWSFMGSKGPISSSRDLKSAGESLDAAIDAALSDEPKDGAATTEVKAFIEGLEGK